MQRELYKYIFVKKDDKEEDASDDIKRTNNKKLRWKKSQV